MNYRRDEMALKLAESIMGPDWVERNIAPPTEPNPCITTFGADGEWRTCAGCVHFGEAG